MEANAGTISQTIKAKMIKKLERIRSLHLFAALSDQQFAALTDKARISTLDKSQPLFRRGDDASSFYVLTEGTIKLSMDSPQGIEKVLMIVRPYELFAEAVMFMQKHQFPVNAVALKASEVIAFDAKLFISFLRESPDLCLNMLSLLSVRLHRHISEIETLSTQNSTSRVLNYLGSIITDDGSNRATFVLDTSKKNLASRLSITPETFSRILHKLTLDGVLEISGREIVIPDLSKYRHYLSEA